MAITHLSIITLNVNGISSPIKTPRWLNGLLKASINICLLYVVHKRYTSKLKTENESERIKKDIPSQGVNPKENQLWYLLEGLMLKLQYFGHLMRRANSLEETPMEKQTEGRRRGDDRRQDGWMASPTQWT